MRVFFSRSLPFAEGETENIDFPRRGRSLHFTVTPMYQASDLKGIAHSEIEWAKNRRIDGNLRLTIARDSQCHCQKTNKLPMRASETANRKEK